MVSIFLSIFWFQKFGKKFKILVIILKFQKKLSLQCENLPQKRKEKGNTGWKLFWKHKWELQEETMKSTSILQLVAKGLACRIFPNQGWKLFKSH